MDQIIIGLLVGVGITVVLVIIFRNKLFTSNPKQQEELYTTVAQTVEMKMREMMPEALKSANEQLVLMAEQKLGSEKKEIRADMDGKRTEIERMVRLIQEDLQNSKKELEQSEKERVGSFMALKNSLEEYKQITQQLAVTTEGLKKVLSNNQLRGQFGEQVADELLKMAGFVRGQDYDFNKEMAGSETRPDFTIFLPDKTKINVDSKFPYSNLQKYSECDTKEGRDDYLKLFQRDVKEKIKQVSTRDYINPDDNTVDFAILFIPNEMIFSFIYDKMNDVWAEAMQKKVVLAGPFSFTAILRLVRQAYGNFKIQQNIREIVGHINGFEMEFGKFLDEFRKIGPKIQSLENQYELVNTTRVNQLVRRVEKVKLADSVEQIATISETSPVGQISLPE